MSAAKYYWAVVGYDKAGIYESNDCPFIACGRGTPPIPLAIQCTSEHEARHVAMTLQPVLDSLPRNPKHLQLLNAFDTPAVRSLLQDSTEFYAVVIGSPPGIHRTAESATRAEAFMIVKGVTQHMPPMVRPAEITVGHSLGSDLTQTLMIPHSPQTPSASASCVLRLRPESPSKATPPPTLPRSSRTVIPAEKTAVDSLCSDLTQTLVIAPSARAPSSRPKSSSSAAPSPSLAYSSHARSDMPTRQTEVHPIVYNHIRTLHGVIASHYYPTTTTRILDLAQPLGNLAAHYLASHGYGREDVSIIVQAYRETHGGEQFVMSLARRGMAISEVQFLLLLIDNANA
ncbi:hypothetical protein BKA83DRAFT_4503241 [Pisolithus microcarpus]|nr:hypothetical protein BKA83DRAFT_4503241 [Pisolithus microcarpus]